MTEHTDVIVIGAGHNGLVCASWLARAGRKVICVDAATDVGGMARLAHLAYPLCDSIRKGLQLDRYGYTPGTPVDTIALAADGNHLTIGQDGVTGRGLCQADIDAYAGFRGRYLAFAKALRPLLEDKPPRLKDMPFADTRTLAKLGWNVRVRLGRDAMYELLRVAAMNIYDVLDEAFEDERLKGAIALDAVLGSAMGPRTPGTVLTWLQRLSGELNGPLSRQQPGSRNLIDALEQSARNAGVEFRLGSRVQKIQVEGGAARRVTFANGDSLTADVVASSADPRATFGNLVGAPALDAMFANRVQQIRGKGVTGTLNLTLSERPTFSGLDDSQLDNRLLVAPSMKYIEQAFNYSKYGECSERPLLQIVLHRNQDDKHTLSVNASYLPYDLKAGWDNSKDDVSHQLISLLAQYAPGLEQRVVGSDLRTPADIEHEYGAVGGHWHHGELSMHQSFMMRPLYGAAEYDTPIDGLFLCGAGSHPGGGLHGLAGRNAARRILEKRGTT
jgi:phytoene dehydrogenase-like protein